MIKAKDAAKLTSDFHDERTKLATKRFIATIEKNIGYAFKRGARLALVPIPLYVDKVGVIRLFQSNGYNIGLTGNANDLVRVEWS